MWPPMVQGLEGCHLRSGHGSLTPADIKPSRNLPTVRMRQTNYHACEDSSQLVPIGRRFYSVLVKYLKRQGFIRNSLQHFVRLPRFLTRTSTSVIIVDPRRRSIVNIRILVLVLVANRYLFCNNVKAAGWIHPDFKPRHHC